MVGDVGGDGFWGVTDLATDADMGGAGAGEAQFLEGVGGDAEAFCGVGFGD